MSTSFRSEYNAFWRCVQAGATYLFVQLCKVLAYLFAVLES